MVFRVGCYLPFGGNGGILNKAILADRTEVPLVRKPGEIFYNGPTTHKIANTGNTPIHNLIAELKKVMN
jgi:hypothetical protein